jgi:hypothetical protein
MTNITQHNDDLPTIPDKDEREFNNPDGIISKADQETDETLKDVTVILLKKLIAEELRGNDYDYLIELCEMLDVDTVLGNTGTIEETLKEIHNNAEDIVKENFSTFDERYAGDEVQ